MDETSSTVLSFEIDDSGSGKRLDAFLSEQIAGWSRSRLQRLIEVGDVLVNDRETKASYRLRKGDEVEAELTEEPARKFEPENIPLAIVYEDEYLAVIDKPAGMVVHPGAGTPSGTLANAVAWHFSFPAVGERVNDRVGIVHRLDKDTSGLIVVAKNEETHEALAEQFRRRTVFKSYVVLVHGSPREERGTIDRPIARDRWHRTKMTVAANGRAALSKWKVRKRFEKFALLEVEIKTGRTHQIRVHLASINHPVVGDTLYNEGRDNTINDVEVKRAVESLGRFFLHSERLAFTHPVSGERIDLTSQIPKELAELLSLL